ncbi:hypothetical protein [Tenacibaculum sp.]|uniref:hypothetical protein n=1 Tax=Tenacibaculum sp. TaxID=1906242 RepID=UPI003D136705
MKKRIISISLTVLFLGLIIAPTVIAVLDDSIDTSIFYSITEEEENGKAKNLISPFSLGNTDISPYFLLEDNQFFCYRFKNYPKPHLNLISPPPELSIL